MTKEWVHPQCQGVLVFKKLGKRISLNKLNQFFLVSITNPCKLLNLNMIFLFSIFVCSKFLWLIILLDLYILTSNLFMRLFSSHILFRFLVTCLNPLLHFSSYKSHFLFAFFVTHFMESFFCKNWNNFLLLRFINPDYVTPFCG